MAESGLAHHQITKNTDDEEDFFFAMQLSSSLALPWALKAVVDLEVFDVLAKAGPGAYLSASEIIVNHHTPKNADRAAEMLDRILCLLVSHSVLSCSAVTLESGHVERRYGLTQAAKHLAKREDGVSMSWFLPLVLQKGYYTAWANLKDMVLEGGEVRNEHSIAMDECEKDPNIGKIYNKSQYSLTTVVMEKMMEIYKGFEGVKSLVDVGGGVGTASSFIRRRYPSIKVINFDLPRVIEEAPVIPGVEHVGGDMFVSLPKAEAIFMKNITHNWSDEHCLKFLRNCYEAVPDDGKVIIMEFITPQVPEPKHSMRNFYQLDVIVMAVSGGGKERDEEDFNVLGKKAGIASVKTACCAYGFWVIELRKTP